MLKNRLRLPCRLVPLSPCHVPVIPASLVGGCVMPRRSAIRFGLISLAVAGLVIGLARAQSRHSDGFNGPDLEWQRGPATVPFTEEAHAVTDKAVHSLPNAEYIRIKADPTGQLNPSIRYEYP